MERHHGCCPATIATDVNQQTNRHVWSAAPEGVALAKAKRRCSYRREAGEVACVFEKARTVAESGTLGGDGPGFVSSSTPCGLCQAVLVGLADGLGAVAGASLVQDPVDVGLDGCVAEDELVCDLVVR